MTAHRDEPADRGATAPPVIDLAGVSVALEGRPVLRGIDLTVLPAEIVAVLGGNGSGKSTLVRTLLGLVPVLRGDVRLFGSALADFRDWRRIGYVPQRLGAGTGVPATVREVVSAGRLSHRRILRPSSADDRAAVTDAIEAVGLTDRSHDAAGSLSGGQQQRVLIARALATQPELLVLDEPTAGVDLPSQGTFADVLRAMVDRGVTIVLVAHELGPLEPLVTRAVVMHDGRVGYDGPPSGTAWLTHTHGGHHHDLSDPGTGSFPVVASPVDRQRDAPQGGTP